MNKLQALNTWMTPKMPLLILGALALGLLFPDQIGLLCPAVSALMMFQTFANSLGSSVQDLGRVLSHPKPVLITMLSLHLLMPLAALGIGSMCFPDQPRINTGEYRKHTRDQNGQHSGHQEQQNCRIDHSTFPPYPL